MYFSIGPKERKGDFFNFEQEYKELKEAIYGPHRIIVIKGLRRTGKTSLMRVVYNEIKGPKIFIDTREIPEITAKCVNLFMREIFLDYVKKEKILEAIFSYIKSIELGLKVTLRKERPILSKLLIEINEELERKGKKLTIFIDEAQVLKRVGFDRLLAFIYDRLKNFKVILAGSEIGLLDELIGIESGAPLYGRAKKIIEIKRLERDKSVQFLKLGFSQVKKRVSEEEINEVVDKLDGIIGWLTAYGFYSLEKGHEEALKKTLTEGSKIIADEIEKFLSNRKIARKRYLSILSLLSIKPLTWTEIERGLTVRGDKVPESRLSQLLESLQDYGFVEKANGHYKLSDPLIVGAVKLLTGRK